PDCDFARPYSTNVPCPKCAKGELVERTTKRGKIFYSCNQYPSCDFALWQRPILESCPQCGSPYLIEKKTRSGPEIICPNQKCGFKKESEENIENSQT
ncbi:MAG: topoisomerase DNA-binding C4 zinc finger domain-containing protein, partial [Desulfovibrio sp.]|nr:topoisomerase DNA-binding C4 zinc finger domain-containing protein [Desulfovibrio sp.]